MIKILAQSEWDSFTDVGFVNDFVKKFVFVISPLV